MTAVGRAASPRLRRLLLGGVLLALSMALVAPAAAGAVPPTYPNGWSFSASGLRQLASTTDTRALCKGPSGSVYEVAMGTKTGYDAVMSRIRVSDGHVLKRWTYPATASADNYIPRTAAHDSKGDLVVAIGTQTGGWDWLVVKYTRAGKVVWKRHYDSGNGQDTPYGIAIDHHDGVIVAGTSEATDGQYDSAIVKWSAKGKRLWTHVVGMVGKLDLIGSVAVDASDNVYVAGELGLSLATNSSATVRSYKPSGHSRWSVTVSDPVSPLSFRFVVVRGKGVYVAGQAGSSGSSRRLLAAKYTLAGKKAWGGVKAQAYASGAWADGLTVDRKGRAIVAAKAYAAGGSGEDLAAVWKLTSAGGTAWHREFSNSAWPHDGEFNAVRTDSKCRVYAAGDVNVTGTTGNLLMVRYSAAGSEQAMWRSHGQQSGYCAFSDLLVLTDKQVIAAGQVAGNGADAALYRAKTTP
jgi:hypothetical protein